jgi:hypothetical protein
VLESSRPLSHSAPDVLMCRGGTVKNSHDWREWYMVGDEDGFDVMNFVGGLVLTSTIGRTHKDE